MSDLVKSLRETVLLVPMKNGGEMVTGLGEFAADRIEALEDVIQLTIDDLLMRGEVGRKGERVVNLSASVWDRLNDAVENKEALKEKDQ